MWAIGALVGLVIGPFALRLRGSYLAIITLGLVFIGQHIFENWDSVTGGLNGTAVSAPVALGPLDFADLSIGGAEMSRDAGYFYLIWGVVAVVALLVKNLMRTRLGRAFQAVRDRDAAAEVIIEKGLGAFSLREVARRAGVSHAAPGYHFGDLRGLLTALATQGLQVLYDEMATAAEAEPDPAERLTAIGRAYVRVALSYPAHCQVIWREDLIEPDDPGYTEASLAAFGVLEQTIEAIAEAHNPELVIEDAAKLCWSAMQGLVELQPKLVRLDERHHDRVVGVEEMVARFAPLLIAGLAARPEPVQGIQPAASQRS